MKKIFLPHKTSGLWYKYDNCKMLRIWYIERGLKKANGSFFRRLLLKYKQP